MNEIFCLTVAEIADLLKDCDDYPDYTQSSTEHSSSCVTKNKHLHKKQSKEVSLPPDDPQPGCSGESPREIISKLKHLFFKQAEKTENHESSC